MSRVGKQIITIPAGVEVKIDDQAHQVKVKGPKGELSMDFLPVVKFEQKDNEINTLVNDDKVKNANAMWGLFRSLLNNMILGVTEGYEKKLEINGVGFKAAVTGKNLKINAGYSHPIEFPLPDGIEAKVEANLITISGIDKQLVGETAAQIRKIRKPEPYKGKGIKYVDEVIRRKSGKAAKASE